MTTFDEYRVSLFKKKIRECLPEMEGLRFDRSNGRCHLIIKVSWRYDKKFCDKIGKYIVGTLKQNGIESRPIRDQFGLSKIFRDKPVIDYVAIPIDQEALPERKR